jgi:hypothetical protein
MSKTTVNIKKAQDLLRADKLQSALLATEALAEQADEELHTDITLMLSRHYGNEKAFGSGTQTQETYEVKRQRMKASLQDILKELEEIAPQVVAEVELPSEEEAKATTKTTQQYANKIYNINHIDKADFS